MTQPPPETVTAVVVGAGMSGLAAADRLQEQGVDCIVLEARDRVGGRVHSEPLWGTWVDHGGQWLGPGQDRAYSAVRRWGLRTMPTHVAGRKTLLFGGRLTHHTGRIPKLPPAAVADVAQAQWRFDRLAATVDLRYPWRTPDAARLDSQTFETWLGRTARTSAGREFFRVAAQAVFATESSNLSLLHVLFYARSGTSLEVLLSSEGGAQQDRVVGGMQQVAAGYAGALGDRIFLSSPVTGVRQHDHGVRVLVGDRVVDASFAIVSVPPSVAGGIAFDPPLPVQRAQLLQRMPHGSVVKFHAAYQRPFWRDEDLSGEAAGDLAPIKVVFDNSPPTPDPGILVGFFEGEDAVVASRHSRDVRREVVRAHLQRFFGPRAADLTGYTDTDWSAEIHTRGCYGAHLPPGAWTQFGSALRTPVGRVHWAGSETAERWCGYIDGAISSGERAADEVLTRIPR